MSTLNIDAICYSIGFVLISVLYQDKLFLFFCVIRLYYVFCVYYYLGFFEFGF